MYIAIELLFASKGTNIALIQRKSSLGIIFSVNLKWASHNESIITSPLVC